VSYAVYLKEQNMGMWTCFVSFSSCEQNYELPGYTTGVGGFIDQLRE
jgi:hypothetical protein